MNESQKQSYKAICRPAAFRLETTNPSLSTENPADSRTDAYILTLRDPSHAPVHSDCVSLKDAISFFHRLLFVRNPNPVSFAAGRFRIRIRRTDQESGGQIKSHRSG